MEQAIMLYVPVPNEEEATRLAHHLVYERVVACVNITPMTSMYWWTGQVVREGEYLLLAKTTRVMQQRAIAVIHAMHLYQTPCIAVLPITVNEDYAAWMKKEIKNEEHDVKND